MKRIGVFTLSVVVLIAAGPRGHCVPFDSEAEAIRAVAEAYLSAEPLKLRDAFLSTTVLYTTDDKNALRSIPFASYLDRVSRNANATREEHSSTIDFVDRTGNVAIVKLTTVHPQAKVTDYLSLVRINEQWKIVNKVFFVEPHSIATTSLSSQSGSGATNKACSSAEQHRFKFMVGKWHTIDPGTGTAAAAEGDSTIDQMLDGCVIHEHRSLNRQGKRIFDGDAYWGYDSTTRHWLLFYMDDLSHMQVYEGREEGGRLAFYRERPDPDGKMAIVRIAYTPTGPSSYTQVVERSNDQGANWSSGGITTYTSER